MLDNYYVNEAALCIEHKTPSPPPLRTNHTILETGEQPLHYRTHYCQLFYNEMSVCIGSLGQEHYSQSKEQVWAM